jgi:hypothetical protein
VPGGVSSSDYSAPGLDATHFISAAVHVPSQKHSPFGNLEHDEPQTLPPLGPWQVIAYVIPIARFAAVNHNAPINTILFIFQLPSSD